MCILILVMLVAYTLYNPTFLAKSVAKKYRLEKEPCLEDELDVKCEFLPFTDSGSNEGSDRLPIYYFEPSSTITDETDNKQKTKRLIIEIPGGTFVTSYINFNAYRAMDIEFDVAVVKYPLLFRTSARQAILYLEKAISQIIDRFRAKWGTDNFKICLIGHSAGAYYAIKLLNRGKFAQYIDKFVGLCGYYGKEWVDNPIVKILDSVYLTSIFNSPEFKCTLPPVNVELFLATSSQDWLKASTIKFSQFCHVLCKIYNEEDHMFLWATNSRSTRLAYAELKEFIARRY